MATFQGTTAVQEQPKKRTWSSNGGWVSVRSWVGRLAEINTYAISGVPAGYESLSITELGPDGELSAVYPDSQTLITDTGVENITWELLGNDLEKELTTCALLVGSAPSDTVLAELATAKNLAANPPSDTALTAAANAAALKASVESLGTEAKNYYKLLVAGTSAYVISQFVLRKTIKVARDATVTASLSNTNKVEAPTGVPTTLFAVPTEQGDGTIEWLKKPPTVVYLGKGKFSITQEWWAAKWSKVLYNGTALP